MADLEAKDPEKAKAVKESLDANGWALVKPKAYGTYPYKKPFDTPTGKMEIYAFWPYLKANRKGVPGLPAWEPVKAYTLPRSRTSSTWCPARTSRGTRVSGCSAQGRTRIRNAAP